MTLTEDDYILKCIELAKKGKGYVSPNPMVGAVIVHNGIIIGEGYHEFYGGPHAEVNAVMSVRDKSLLEDSTIYVSLEPCAHFGKTPPCAQLIIDHKFKKVVVGTKDPFAKVNGKGIQMIEEAGIEVTLSSLDKECQLLNKRFIKAQSGLPYVILKWAQTNDGFIDKERNDETGINWITQKETKQITHSWRHEEDAILVGRTTVENDNPELTVRAIEGKNPIKVIIDPNLKLTTDYNVFSTGSVIVLNEIKTEISENIEYVQCHTNNFLKDGLITLAERGIQSIIIEGGASTLKSFIDLNLWDEARVLTGSTEFKKGLLAPQLSAEPSFERMHGADKISFYYA